MYSKGKIVPLEAFDAKREGVELIITLLDEEKIEFESTLSKHEVLYTMGDGAVRGKHKDVAEKHDRYLYFEANEN